MTLDEILKSQDKDNVKEALLSLVDSTKKQEQDKLNAFLEVLARIVESQDNLTEAIGEMKDTLGKILTRPHPVFPEQKDMVFPSVQEIAGEVTIKKPDWYKEVVMPPTDMSGMANIMLPMFQNLIDTIR